MFLRIVFRKGVVCVFLKKKLLFFQPLLIVKHKSKFDKSLFLHFYVLLILYRIGLVKIN